MVRSLTTALASAKRMVRSIPVPDAVHHQARAVGERSADLPPLGRGESAGSGSQGSRTFTSASTSRRLSMRVARPGPPPVVCVVSWRIAW